MSALFIGDPHLNWWGLFFTIKAYIMTISKYHFTLTTGLRIMTTATSLKAAMNSIMSFEGCPLSAFKRVKISKP